MGPACMKKRGEVEHGGEEQSKRVHLYGTTMYDRAMGKYRMWYMCRMGPHWRFKAHTVPGLYIPRSSRNPSTFLGQTHDAHGRKFVENDRGDLICYAESNDGIKWEKPNLGIFKFNGSGNNNIVWDLHGASVFVDDSAPPELTNKDSVVAEVMFNMLSTKRDNRSVSARTCRCDHSTAVCRQNGAHGC